MKSLFDSCKTVMNEISQEAQEFSKEAKGIALKEFPEVNVETIVSEYIKKNYDIDKLLRDNLKVLLKDVNMNKIIAEHISVKQISKHYYSNNKWTVTATILSVLFIFIALIRIF